MGGEGALVCSELRNQERCASSAGAPIVSEASEEEKARLAAELKACIRAYVHTIGMSRCDRHDIWYIMAPRWQQGTIAPRALEIINKRKNGKRSKSKS